MNIYVGNISRETADQELRNLFEEFGQVTSVRIIKDNETGEPRGFAFVEMPVEAEAQRALKELNGQAFQGRRLKANEARPKAAGPRVYNSFSSNFGYKDRYKY